MSFMALKPVEIQEAEARFPGADACIIEHRINRYEGRSGCGSWTNSGEGAASIKDHISNALSSDVGDALRNG